VAALQLVQHTHARCGARVRHPPTLAPGPPPAGAPQLSIDEISVYASIDNKPVDTRQRVVVLGSGWAAASFLKALPKDVK
jgi:hypothetical protein